MEQKDQSCKTLLASLTVDDIPMQRDSMVEIGSDLTAKQALDVLLRENLSSVPVADPEEESFMSYTPPSYIGFADVRDMVALVVADMKTQGSDEAVTLRRLMGDEDVLPHRSAEMTVNWSGSSPFRAVAPGTSLLEVAQLLASGLHRVAVVDPVSGKAVKVVTQSALLQLLAAHLDKLGAVTQATVAGTEAVVSASEDVTAGEAFQRMAAARLSAMPVVDGSGDVVSMLSCSDIRIMASKYSYELLTRPVLEFVTAVRCGPDALAARAGRSLAPSVNVTPQATVGEVMRLLAATRIHRVVVTKPGTRQPLAIVALTDVLRQLLEA